MIALADQEPCLRNVWHPEPEHCHIVTENITLNVFTGPEQGQLNTGEVIDLAAAQPA